MASERKCPNCGAGVARRKDRFCGYCGHEVPQREVVVAAAPTGPFGDLPARFQALREHHRLQDMMDLQVSSSQQSLQYGCLIAFGIVFAVFAMPVLLGFFALGPFAAIPLLFVGIGIAISVINAKKLMDFQAAPIEKHLAVVVGERQHVSGGGRNSSASTSYHVTIEREDGQRDEYRTTGKVIGRVSPGDIGVAHVKGGHLLGFARAVV